MAPLHSPLAVALAATFASPAHLAAFMGVSVLLTLAPGPDMALVLRNGLRAGPSAGWWTGLGCSSGIALWAAAAVAGLSALVVASPLAYEALRLAGAAYLAYLGLASLLASYRGRAPLWGEAGAEDGPGRAAKARGGGGRAEMWRQGFASNLLNPKIALLFLTLLPQFAGGGSPHGGATAELAVAFLALALLWWRLFTLALVPLGRLMSKPPVQRFTGAAAGIVLVGLGLEVLLGALG